MTRIELAAKLREQDLPEEVISELLDKMEEDGVLYQITDDVRVKVKKYGIKELFEEKLKEMMKEMKDIKKDRSAPFDDGQTICNN